MNEFAHAGWAEWVCAAGCAVGIPVAAVYAGWLERRFSSESRGPRGSLLSPLSDDLRRLGDRSSAVPAGIDGLFVKSAPLFVFVAAMIALAAIAVGPGFAIARGSNVGVLFAVSVASVGVLGGVAGAWAANREDGVAALRTAIQIVSFLIVAGFALVAGLALAGTFRVGEIVEAQQRSGAWFAVLSPFAFLLYFVASMLATQGAPANRSPLHGSGGLRNVLYALADQVTVILIAAIGVTLFWGGWLRPFANVRWLNWLDAVPATVVGLLAVFAMVRAGKQASQSDAIQLWLAAAVGVALAVVLALAVFHEPMQFLQASLHGVFWFCLKTILYVVLFLWLRTSLPRLRFDQLMEFCWTLLLPLAIGTVIATAAAVALNVGFNWIGWLTFGFADVVLLGLTVFLISIREAKAVAKLTPPPAPALETDAHVG